MPSASQWCICKEKRDGRKNLHGTPREWKIPPFTIQCSLCTPLKREWHLWLTQCVRPVAFLLLLEGEYFKSSILDKVLYWDYAPSSCCQTLLPHLGIRQSRTGVPKPGVSTPLLMWGRKEVLGPGGRWTFLFIYLFIPMIAILLSSSVGMSIEWLTGVSQVLGSRTDMFSCELKIHLRLWCIHCVRTILSPGCTFPSLIFYFQCVCSCVCIWCWLLCQCACESEWV